MNNNNQKQCFNKRKKSKMYVNHYDYCYQVSIKNVFEMAIVEDKNNY